jgi:hypothetical protein
MTMAEESIADAVTEILKLVEEATELGRARIDGGKTFKSTGARTRGWRNTSFGDWTRSMPSSPGWPGRSTR